MKTVGPYRVRGAVRWEDGRKVLAAEDSSLGREAWVVLRPKSSPPPDAARRELSRATRPRWLAGGEQAEGRWDAFVAPSGCPLADLAGPDGLPWRDARPLIDDISEELAAACLDGTLPPGLTIDQVWVQPDGRALIVDGLARPEASGPGDEASRALDLLRRSAAVALEGGKRRLDDSETAIRAPVPIHAHDLLTRLSPGHPQRFRDVASFRQALDATRDHTTEATRLSRASQLGVMAAILSVSLLIFFGAPLLVMIGRYEAFPAQAEDVAREQTRILEEAFVVMGGAVALMALGWSALSAAFGGGLSFLVMGLGLVRRDGVRASRLRIFWRSLVVWLVPALLLIGALYVQDTWKARWPSWTLFGIAAGLVAASLPIALIRPDRGPHDVLAGTVVVPR